ncbi:MAG: hypothetical protein U0R24_13820 [Solirubrobacterales bacterium]
MHPALTAAVAFAIAAVAVLGGCGGEKEFTPESFIDAMNDNGATLELGPVLTTNPDGIEVHEVSFASVAPSATGEGEETEGENGAASLLVFDGADDARDEFERCNAAPALTCFRAANAVLRVENLQPSDRARITTAIQGLAEEG